MMWNETVKANCSRDSNNADNSITLSFRDKGADGKSTRVRLNRHASRWSAGAEFDDLDCRGLLDAGRGRCRQGCVVLNLGLAAVANEVFRSELAELVFREPLSVAGKFGGLIEVMLRNYSGPTRMA
jgi:hypothetical protein